MKIISWNVNGVQARRKALIKFIKNTEPDILCLQEVKTECTLNLPGYEQYWNLAQEKGYAGTAVFTKKKPIACSNGIGIKKYDQEGRAITLEFEDFFLVNTYVPSYNTASPPERREYRERWDIAYRRYVTKLSKPTILCGDFNVAREAIDTYSDRIKENSALLFQPESEFRESFEQLLSTGFIDVFRTLNPSKEGVYSWWGPKNNNRLEDRGSRLDYILVSPQLLSYVQNLEYKKDVLGSDHCPVSVIITPPVLYADHSEEELSARWQTIDWKKMQTLLREMQRELTKAVDMRNWELAAQLQAKIVHSWPARALAVHTIVKIDSAAGVDGVKWKTGAEMYRAAESLTSQNYFPLPYRHKEIVDQNGKKIIVNIPAARDKAMQLLYRYALLPVAESTADKRSFSSREGRSGLDAHAYLLGDLRKDDAPKWVFVGDVKSFYHDITHQRLLETIFMDKEVLQKFLQAGVIRDGEFFETGQGISLGTSISPILANMLLDGLQSYIYDRLYPKGNVDYAAGCMTRFADDIVVLARSREQAIMIQQIVCEFLANRGLRLNEAKSCIANIRKGFDFLSWHYQEKDGVVKVEPSENAVKRFEKKLESLILNSRLTYRNLIEAINTKLTKWANHFRCSDAFNAFRHIDSFVNGLLLRRMCDRHPRWKYDTIKKKYWITEGEFYIFILPEDPTVRITRLATTPVTKHKPCKLDFNPFLDEDYYERLMQKRNVQKSSGKYRFIWQRQEGKCAYCGYPMLPDQDVEIVEKIIGNGNGYANLIYIHKQCSLDLFTTAKDEPIARTNLFEMLGDLIGEIPAYESPYWGLYEFFRLCEKPVVSLTFQEIEEIIGEPLGWEAGYYEEFWYDGYAPEDAEAGWRENDTTSHAIKQDAPLCRIAESWVS